LKVRNLLQSPNFDNIPSGNECCKVLKHLDLRCKSRNNEHPSLAELLPVEHQPYLDALLALRTLKNMANKVSCIALLLLNYSF